MEFEPKTNIYFCRTGIDDSNKIVFSSQEELFTTLTKADNRIGYMPSCSFQRENGGFHIRVDTDEFDYYKLMQADTVVYKNTDSPDAFWIVGNILMVEWKNPNCSFVHWKVDHFMTYQTMIAWDKTYAFIEREHVKDDWASEDGNPLFSNMGPDEGFAVQADTPCFTYEKFWDFNTILIYTPYDESGEPDFDLTQHGTLPGSVKVLAFGSGAANSYMKSIAENKHASINNIVGLYGCPAEFASYITGNPLPTQTTEMIPCINEGAKQNKNIPRFNNAKCWSSPFFTIKLFSSEGQSLEFTPQWFGNDKDNYNLMIIPSICGRQFGGVYATFNPQNGMFNWKVWNDFMVGLTQLPRLMWTADGFTDWQSVNGDALLMRSIAANTRAFANLFGAGASSASEIAKAKSNGAGGNVTSAIGGLSAVGMLNTVTDWGSTLATLGAEVRQAKASGATVNGAGAFGILGDIGLAAWGFKVVYYAAQPYVMECVDNFFDRFGYKVNKLKKLELQNRPIWTFLKTAECHVAASTGVPYISELAINTMFNKGVTMWRADKYNAGRKIGDYSNPKENRGIKGA